VNRLCTTRGVGNWRDRLANPDRQWRRGFSALETAVSWEAAGKGSGWLPEPIAHVFRSTAYERPELLVAIAEHKVVFDGTGGDSQCDVWALLKTPVGTLSMSVEAKAREGFGDGHQALGDWLLAGDSERSLQNRQSRWDSIRKNLPPAEGADGYPEVAYQLLHRCAAAVKEAERFGLQHAAFVVQAFGSPDESFQQFARMCHVMGVSAERDRLHVAAVGAISLGVGWADCCNASDEQIAALV
jgi:hypothetical protein